MLEEWQILQKPPNAGAKWFLFVFWALISAFYPFAFWTVGNLIRDDLNEDFFYEQCIAVPERGKPRNS